MTALFNILFGLLFGIAAVAALASWWGLRAIWMKKSARFFPKSLAEVTETLGVDDRLRRVFYIAGLVATGAFGALVAMKMLEVAR
jgi:hypothetical protein